jgi:hypothetical protein
MSRPSASGAYIPRTDLTAATRWLARLAGVGDDAVEEWLAASGLVDAWPPRWRSFAEEQSPEVATGAAIVLAERARQGLGRLELRGHKPLPAVRRQDRQIVERLGADEHSRRIQHELLDEIDGFCPYPACRTTRAAGLRVLCPDQPELAALAELVAREAAGPLPLWLRAHADADESAGERLAAEVRAGTRRTAEEVLASGVLSGRLAEIAAIDGYGAKFVRLVAQLPAEAGWLLVEVPWLNLNDPPRYDVLRRTATQLERLARCHGWQGRPTLWPSTEPPAGCVLDPVKCERFIHHLDSLYEEYRGDGRSRGDALAYARAHDKLGTLRHLIRVAQVHGLRGHGSLFPVRLRPLDPFTGVADNVPTWAAVVAWLEVAITRLADRPTLLLQLLLLVATAARPREVAHAWQGSFCPIGDGHHQVHIPRPTGKTGASGLILLRPIADALGLRPEMWPATPPPVRPDPGGDLRATVTEIDAYVAVHCPERALPGAVVYRFRHALARALDEQLGEDTLFLVMFLRHLGEQATLLYANVSTAERNEAVEQVWRRIGPGR